MTSRKFMIAWALICSITLLAASCGGANTSTGTSPSPSATAAAGEPPDDATLLPEVPTVSPWTDEEKESLKSVEWARPRVEAALKDGRGGMTGLLELFSDAGASIVDAPFQNRTVMSARAQAHPMWVQVGQLVTLANPLAKVPRVSLNDMLAVLTNYKGPNGGGQLSRPLLRAYFLNSLQNASSPDELAWRDEILVQEEGTHLIAALQSPDEDYTLKPLQWVLLLLRLRADLFQEIIWQSKQEPSTDAQALDLGDRYAQNHLTAFGAPTHLASTPNPPCNLEDTPSIVTDIVAAYNGAISDYIKSALNLTGRSAKFAEYTTVGAAAAGLVATLLNFMFTYLLFKATVSVDPQALARTDKTTEDSARVSVKAEYKTGKDGREFNNFMNCLRLVVSPFGVGISMPEAGPWKGATAKLTYYGSEDAVRWRNPDETLTGLQTIQATTNGDGMAGATLTGLRQPIELDHPEPKHRETVIRTSVNPETMNGWYTNLLQYSVDQIQLALGALAIFTIPGEIALLDASVKDLIHLADAASVFGSDPYNLTINDWTHPVRLVYTAKITRQQHDPLPQVCTTSVTEDTDYELVADIPLGPQTNLDGTTSLVGTGTVGWVTAIRNYHEVYQGGGSCPGGAGSVFSNGSGSCTNSPDPTQIVSDASVVRTIDGKFSAIISAYGTPEQTITINTQPGGFPASSDYVPATIEKRTTCFSTYEQRSNDALLAQWNYAMTPDTGVEAALQRDVPLTDYEVATYRGKLKEDKVAGAIGFGNWSGKDGNTALSVRLDVLGTSAPGQQH